MSGNTDLPRMIRTLVPLVLLAACSACAGHHPKTSCATPAQVFGHDALDGRGAWLAVRPDKSVEETARRIAKVYQVNAEPLEYFHGFSVNQIPVGSVSRLRCEKDIVEIHYPGTATVTSR